MKYRITGVVFALLAWTLNPAYLMGCGGEGTFTFGEAEMLVLLQTIEDGSWEVERDGQSYILDFDLEQSEVLEITRAQKPGFMGSAFACEDRSFLSSAIACVDMSYLGIQGTVDVIQTSTGELVQSGVSVAGSMMVMGLNLSHADVSLTHPDGLFSFSSADGTQFSLNGASW